jgi:polysaccharide export outer membrane protein
MEMARHIIGSTALVFMALLLGCASSGKKTPSAQASTIPAQYLIGPGDELEVFVWGNRDLTVTVPVRPDGRISTPLVEDMQAVGKTPTQLARDMEKALANYVKSPQVNIVVRGFVGTFGEQIRVVGKAAAPKALAYRRNMTLLDVMIEVGGLAEGAAGNRAKIIRTAGGQQTEIKVRLDDLLNEGRISENVEMLPGDVLIVPESRL